MSPEFPHPEYESRPLRISFEEVVQTAKEALLADGQHIPTIIADGDMRALVLQLPDLADTHEQRLEQMVIAGVAMSHRAQIGVLKQVFFVSEGWMSAVENDSEIIRPSLDPNRKEVLTISNLNLEERRTQLCLLEMIRDNNGQIAELKDVQPPADDITVQSPLLQAFVQGFNFGSHRFSSS